jgi:hypothetical protein
VGGGRKGRVKGEAIGGGMAHGEGVGRIAVAFFGLSLVACGSADRGSKGDASVPTADSAYDDNPSVVDANLDRMLQEHWDTEGITPAPRVDDATFLRRTTLDLTGRIPTSEEVLAFEADRRPDKRKAAVRRLLDSEGYAEHFSDVYADLLVEGSLATQRPRLHEATRQWLEVQFAENRRWDDMTRELLTVEGSLDELGPAGFLVSHGRKNRVEAVTAATSRVFLGVHLECAQCHDHPTDPRYAQEDFYGMAAYFARTKIRFKDQRPTIVDRPRGEMRMPTATDAPGSRSGPRVDPRFLGRTAPIGGDQTRREALADTVIASDLFAKTMVNRTWASLMGRGLVEPWDDLGGENDERHPAMLEHLAQRFTASGYDHRALVEAIVLSTAYQRSSAAPTPDAEGRRTRAFAQAAMRPLKAEQLYRSLMMATGVEDVRGRQFRKLVQQRKRKAQREFQFTFADDEMTSANAFSESVPQALLLLKRRSRRPGLVVGHRWDATAPNPRRAFRDGSTPRQPVPRRLRPTPDLGGIRVPRHRHEDRRRLRRPSARDAAQQRVPHHPLKDPTMTLSRRNAIRLGVGALAAGAAGLPLVASATATAAPTKTARALIILYMQGGPSQLDTFDPKPGRPTGGEFASIPTALPGVHFSQHLPRLARRADRMSILRSLTFREGNHDRARYLMHTGYPPQGSTAHPALGAIVGTSLGAGPLPAYVAVGGPGHGGGFLGAAASPFVVRDPRKPVRNVQPAVALGDQRVDSRMDLWRDLQANFGRDRAGPAVKGHSAVVEQALAMTRAREREAFDLQSVSTRERERYGEGTFGQGCLMARRLVESGVSVVEVSMNGWDTHEDNFERVARLSAELDQGMSTLLDDLQASGLLEETAVLWTGDFGRTPNINARGGRGHFPKISNAIVAGGPFTRGAVVGATDRDGREIIDQPVSVPDLFRTLAHAMGIDPDDVRMTPQGRPIYTVDGGTVVRELLD